MIDNKVMENLKFLLQEIENLKYRLYRAELKINELQDKNCNCKKIV